MSNVGTRMKMNGISFHHPDGSSGSKGRFLKFRRISSIEEVQSNVSLPLNQGFSIEMWS